MAPIRTGSFVLESIVQCRGDAETICTLEEEVWLVSGHGHLRQSALVHDLVAQGRAALSPLSALSGFVFPPVPLKGAVMGISMRTRLTCPSHTWHFTSFSSTRPEMCPAREGKLRSAGSVVVLHFSACQICQRLGMPAMCWATCSSLKRLRPLNVPPAEHHLEVKLIG